VAYGAPLGKVYSGVLDQFLDFKLPLDKTLAQAARQEVPQAGLLGSTALPRPARAVVAILYFTSLTVMLFTPLVWNPPYALNMTIGDIRYFR
jgi:hypothetical protein